MPPLARDLASPLAHQVWYGIGVLYERCGSYDHAEDALSGVLKMNPNTERKNEILFRLGNIYKQLQKYQQSLQCFQSVINSPPPPRTTADVWLQIGHLHELQKNFTSAIEGYQSGLRLDPNHPKLMQHIAWVMLQDTPFSNVGEAIRLLHRASELDASDAQTWYVVALSHDFRHALAPLI